jgi:hypothetical protein
LLHRSLHEEDQVNKLTAQQLADRLDGKPTRKFLGKALRPIVFASALAAMASQADARIGANEGGNITSLETTTNGVTSPVTDPDQAYNFGYNLGWAGIEANGMTGVPAIDNAITNGNIQGLEGLPPSPPSENPPPGPRGELEVDPANPAQAYALGYELGLDPAFDVAFDVDVDSPTAAEFGAFTDGIADAEDSAGPSCAVCGSCAGCGGCGSCGGCGGFGGCGGCGGCG